MKRNPILMATLGGSAPDRHGPLSIWTVYDHPADRPDKFVARRWEAQNGPEPVPTNDILEADTLEALRRLLPPHLFRMPRQDGDDPVIVESWI